MKRKPSTATIIASVALFFLSTTPALANPTFGVPSPKLNAHHIKPLRLAAHDGRAVIGCTRKVPDKWGSVAIWVYSNGQEIHSTIAGGTYYAGNGTLVKVWSVPHNGPICAKAMTWQPTTHVSVTFRVV